MNRIMENFSNENSIRSMKYKIIAFNLINTASSLIVGKTHQIEAFCPLETLLVNANYIVTD